MLGRTYSNFNLYQKLTPSGDVGKTTALLPETTSHVHANLSPRPTDVGVFHVKLAKKLTHRLDGVCLVRK